MRSKQKKVDDIPAWRLSQKSRVERQEERAGMLVGGYRHRGSGSADKHKSDASSHDFRVECKSTVNRCLQFKIEWLEKIAGEALYSSQTPCMHFEFVSIVGAPSKWVMIPESFFSELLELRKDRS